MALITLFLSGLISWIAWLSFGVARRQNFFEITRVLQDDHVRAARRVLYELEENGIAYTDWCPEQKHAASSVCQSFNVAAVMLDETPTMQKKLLNVWGTTASRCYWICRPLIAERKETYHWDGFWGYFTRLEPLVPTEMQWDAAKSAAAASAP